MPPRRRMTEDELAASRARATVRRRLKLLWRGDSTDEEIREDLGLDEAGFRALVDEMRLPDRTGQACYEPDPATIRLECAKIRMGWSQVEREARLEAATSSRMEQERRG